MLSLPLEPGHRDALDEAALREEEQGDDRQDDQRGGSHQVVPFGAVMLALEELQAQGKGKVLLVGQVDEGSQEVIYIIGRSLPIKWLKLYLKKIMLYSFFGAILHINLKNK